MTLLLIRHGPTVWNQDRRLQGRADIPLSPEGSQAVAAWRIPHRFRHLPVRCSPLRRAVATAAILGLSPALEPALVELDWGSWEGRSLAELRLGDPQEVAERLLAWHRIFGMDRMLVQMSVGTMPHDQLLRSIELFGTEVAPIVRAEVARRAEAGEQAA